MSIRKSLHAGLWLSAACLAGAAALPAAAQVAATGVTAQALTPHDIDGLTAQAISDAAAGAGQAMAPTGPVAADAAAGDAPVKAGPTVAADLARDSAATTGTCDAYFTQSQALGPLLDPAVKALAAHDSATLIALLPSLQPQLDALPATEVRPEVCSGNHINAYTRHQFIELGVQRAHGVDTGLPAGLPLVKQPDLNQAGLAFVVGWARYEQKDYDGGLAALGKGLAMFPHDHALLNEYAATLVQLRQGAQVVTFVDGALANTYDLDDRERSTLYVARATGLLMLHALDASEQNLTIALRYHYSDQVKKMLDDMRAMRAAAGQAPAPVQK